MYTLLPHSSSTFNLTASTYPLLHSSSLAYKPLSIKQNLMLLFLLTPLKRFSLIDQDPSPLPLPTSAYINTSLVSLLTTKQKNIFKVKL